MRCNLNNNGAVSEGNRETCVKKYKKLNHGRYGLFELNRQKRWIMAFAMFGIF